MNAAIEQLAEDARLVVGRALRRAELHMFGKYLQLLLKWSKTNRLIGSSEPGWVIDRLLLDSLLFLRVLPEHVSSVADVGSGAGLPGVPLSIVRPEMRMTLIESRERRASFLSAVVRELPLMNARVVGGRMEDLVQKLGRQFDAVVMRCAGDFSEVARTAVKLVRPGGSVIASGPPVDTRGPLTVGRWVDVPGIRAGSQRGFAVYDA
jgi:16S rRNA (guanine527-N7)-methyltransferase